MCNGVKQSDRSIEMVKFDLAAAKCNATTHTGRAYATAAPATAASHVTRVSCVFALWINTYIFIYALLTLALRLAHLDDVWPP